MTNIEKIRLCSNIMQEPHTFEQLGPVAGGIARDLTIYTAWNGAAWVLLNVPEFCREFGYSPQHLLKPISQEQRQELLDYGFDEDEVSRHEHKRGGNPLSTYIGYTLAKMAVRKLVFAKRNTVINENGQIGEEKRYNSLELVRDIKIASSPRGTVIRFAANKEILNNSKTRYQTFDFNEYKSLVTESGQKDDQARRMYLRLVWKRKFWDKSRKAQGVNPSEDSYVMLKKVAGLNYSNEAKNASKLRQLLARIGALDSVAMSAEVYCCPATSRYSVKWKRHQPATV